MQWIVIHVKVYNIQYHNVHYLHIIQIKKLLLKNQHIHMYNKENNLKEKKKKEEVQYLKN